MTYEAHEVKRKIEAAHGLLTQPEISLAKFQQVRTPVSGINGNVDATLARLSRHLADYQKIHRGEIVEFTAEHLPEDTPQEKKRKKCYFSFFVRGRTCEAKSRECAASLVKKVINKTKRIPGSRFSLLPKGR